MERSDLAVREIPLRGYRRRILVDRKAGLWRVAYYWIDAAKGNVPRRQGATGQTLELALSAALGLDVWAREVREIADYLRSKGTSEAAA